MSKIALNLISGSLGSGKTTLLKTLLTQKPASEHWILLVNEFGAVGIDGAILSDAGQTQTVQIPGGCICCTALTEMETVLLDIAEHQKPDRVLIEPTGLAEPDAIVDILHSSQLKPLFEIQTLISVLDAANTVIEDLEKMTIMKSLLNMADIIVINKMDLATCDQITALQTFCSALFPPKRRVMTTQNSQINIDELYPPHFHPQTFYFSQPASTSLTPQHNHVMTETSTEADYATIELPGLVQRIFQRSQTTLSAGWVFSDHTTFNWKKLQALFESFATFNGVLRAKAIFRVGRPRMLFQYVQGQTTREIVAYRKDSRIEIILSKDNTFDLAEFELQLKQSITA